MSRKDKVKFLFLEYEWEIKYCISDHFIHFMSNKSFSCPFVSCALERLNSDQSTPVPIIQHTDQTEILQDIIVSYTQATT